MKYKCCILKADELTSTGRKYPKSVIDEMYNDIVNRLKDEKIFVVDSDDEIQSVDFKASIMNSCGDLYDVKYIDGEIWVYVNIINSIKPGRQYITSFGIGSIDDNNVVLDCKLQHLLLVDEVSYTNFSKMERID